MAIENVNNIDKPSSKIVTNRVLIAIYRPNGDKWQSKTLFLAIFYPGSSIVESVLDCHLSCEDMESNSIIGCDRQVSSPVCQTGVVHVLLHVQVTLDILSIYLPVHLNTFAAKHIKKPIPQCQACFKDS